MPGTPEPAFGSGGVTFAVAVVAGVAVAGSVVVAGPRLLGAGGKESSRRDSAWRESARRLLAVGLAYAVGCLLLWTAARAVARPATFGSYRPAALAGFLLLAVVVLALQAVVPAYLHARWQLVAPPIGLIVATTFVVDAFLHVGGESDVLWLYALFFGPVVVVALAALGLLELGGRRLVARVAG